MKERFVLVNAAVAGIAIACGSDLQSAPKGFSHDTDDYAYQIRVDIDEAGSHDNNYAKLFTNKKPVLTADGGQSHLIATDVYCPPESNNSFVKEAGCTKQFMRVYEIVSPKRISVSDNIGIE